MLKVGQKLWLVYHERRRGEPCEVEVVKVGRKWATLNRNRGRIDIETLHLDGGHYSSAGRCYLFKEQYESERDLSIAWVGFKREIHDMSGVAPKGVTIEKIKQARELLGLPEKE
jgi:hypothetical protein